LIKIQNDKYDIAISNKKSQKEEVVFDDSNITEEETMDFISKKIGFSKEK